jgi:hypothetical protein
MIQANSFLKTPNAPPWTGFLQLTLLIVFCAVTIGLTAIQIPASLGHFEKYFGGLNPILVVSGAGVAAVAVLPLLRFATGFQIIRGRKTLYGIAYSAGFATLLGIAIAIADILIRYAEDTNVPVPEALLFYPTVGFVAEVVFHLVPLTLVVVLLIPLRRLIQVDRIVWIAILITAVSEPTFQILFEGEPLTWAAGFTWVHVFAIAFLQLYVFKRFDFATMYAFRIVYYAYWHVIWGVIRLRVLF